MLVTLDQAEQEYAKLNDNDKLAVGQIMMDARRKYVMSGMTVDVPYFFASIYRNMYATKEEWLKFIEIKTSKEFSIDAIYLISRFILAAKEGTVVSQEDV